jgi:hypothetical protein
MPNCSNTLLKYGPSHYKGFRVSTHPIVKRFELLGFLTCPNPNVRPVASAALNPTMSAHFSGTNRTIADMCSAAWRARLCAISWPRIAARPSSSLAIGRMPLYTKTFPPGITKAFFSAAFFFSFIPINLNLSGIEKRHTPGSYEGHLNLL